MHVQPYHLRQAASKHQTTAHYRRPVPSSRPPHPPKLG
ncbi:hypothetical protein ABLN97_11765, partial [Mycobacterium tuberculosis]